MSGMKLAVLRTDKQLLVQPMSATISKTVQTQLQALLIGLALAISLPVSASDESIAVLVLNQSENSIPRGNLVYTPLVVSLHKKLEQADQSVTSLMLEDRNQPDWTKGLRAVKNAVKRFRDRSLKTVILVDATQRSIAGSQSEIELSYRFYDTKTRKVYRTFQATAVVETGSCGRYCELRRTAEEFRQLDQSLSSVTIASLPGVQLPTLAQVKEFRQNI